MGILLRRGIDFNLKFLKISQRQNRLILVEDIQTGCQKQEFFVIISGQPRNIVPLSIGNNIHWLKAKS
jgi:hypothetical protein